MRGQKGEKGKKGTQDFFRKKSCVPFFPLFLLLWLCLPAFGQGERPPYYELIGTFGSTGSEVGQFRNPRGMAISPDGLHIAVSDTENHRVVLLTTGYPPPPPPPAPRPKPPTPPELPPPVRLAPPVATGTVSDSFDADYAGVDFGEPFEIDWDWVFGGGGTGTIPSGRGAPSMAPADGRPAGDSRGVPTPRPEDPTTSEPAPAEPKVEVPVAPAPPTEAAKPILQVWKVLAGIWPWEGSKHPHDPPDRFRERDNADGIEPRRAISGRAYHGGQARIRPWSNVPMDRFHYPEGVVWKDDRTIVVADTANHLVKAVRPEGDVLWVLGQEGWKDGYFHFPLGVIYDGKGNLYVTEPRGNYHQGLGFDLGQRPRVQGNRLQIFGPDFKPVYRPDGGLKRDGRLGHMHHQSGVDGKQFKSLTRVWVSPDGDIYLVDAGNHRVLVYDTDLKKKGLLKEWPFYQLRYPCSIDGDGNGHLAIVDTGHHRVLVLAPDGTIEQILGGFGVEPRRFSYPREARFAPNGDLYVLDSGNGRIQIFRRGSCPFHPDRVVPRPSEPIFIPPRYRKRGHDALVR